MEISLEPLGYVGIGTTTPQSELHIYSKWRNEGAYITFRKGGSGEVPTED